MSNLAPGVYVSEVDSPAYTTSTPTNTVAVFIGAHTQGPTTPQLIQSWGNFATLYGGLSTTVAPSDLQMAVYDYFNNGGGQCYVLRVVHSDAVAASANLQDATPATTLTVTAANPGTWANNLYVQVTAGIDADHFGLNVFLGGTSGGNQVEQWTNLDMTLTDSRYALTVVNNVYNGSSYITLTDPGVGDVPVAGDSAVQLGSGSGSTAGANGSTVTSSDLTATTSLLDQLDQPLLINLPNVTDTTDVLGPMIDYVTTTRASQDSVVIVDPPSAQSPAAVVNYASELPTSSYAVLYYPWPVISDPASAVSGSTRTVPPGAFAMGQMAKIDAQVGPWQAAAGQATSLSAITLERSLTTADLGNLTAAEVNAFRYLAGSGLVIWGARTLSNVISVQYINVRRTLIFIEANLKQLTSFAVFQNNGPALWTQISLRLNNWLAQVWASGALAGSVQSDAFYVTCDDTNNVSTSSTTYVDVGVATLDPAEFVLIQVSQWSGGTTVTEASTAATS